MKRITSQQIIDDIKGLMPWHDGVPFGNILWANSNYKEVFYQKGTYEEKKKLVDAISDVIMERLNYLIKTKRIKRVIPKFGKTRYFIIS